MPVIHECDSPECTHADICLLHFRKRFFSDKMVLCEKGRLIMNGDINNIGGERENKSVNDSLVRQNSGPILVKLESYLLTPYVEGNRSVKDLYQYGKALGDGEFAAVRIGYSRRTGAPFALKQIWVQGCSRESIKVVLREAELMK